jgi:hypothetical protein
VATVADALPYAELNLRRNPFGELDRTARAELAVAEVAPLAAVLATPGHLVQLLGESGRGKTTLLLALRARFPAAPYVKILQLERPRLPHGHPLFVDDAHVLPARRRQRLFRRHASFAITSHVDLSEEAELLGLQVTSVRPAHRLDGDVLARIFSLRIEAARRAPGPVPSVSRSTVERLVRRHGEDVRAMELALYEGVQRLKEVGDVQV